ncbi:hypothetical protein, partial [Microcoleus sp. OTE_8_concoct_300]|uniref:hypothetical protein n=1 Tax=Microcoleus sp. OTE_8_concoct_300 TaxID=2964710 RepID=UPI00403FAC0D
MKDAISIASFIKGLNLAAYRPDCLGDVPSARERRISTLITCFGLAARCGGLQSPTSANPSRYKVSMVSRTPLGEP